MFLARFAFHKKTNLDAAALIGAAKHEPVKHKTPDEDDPMLRAPAVFKQVAPLLSGTTLTPPQGFSR